MFARHKFCYAFRGELNLKMELIEEMQFPSRVSIYSSCQRSKRKLCSFTADRSPPSLKLVYLSRTLELSFYELNDRRFIIILISSMKIEGAEEIMAAFHENYKEKRTPKL